MKKRPRTKPPAVNLIAIDRVHARRLFFFLWQIAYKGRNIFLILLVNIVLGWFLFSVFDDKSFAEGQYLALITAMTIGYGDLAPASDVGRAAATGAAVLGQVYLVFIVARLVALYTALGSLIGRSSRAKEDHKT